MAAGRRAASATARCGRPPSGRCCSGRGRSPSRPRRGRARRGRSLGISSPRRCSSLAARGPSDQPPAQRAAELQVWPRTESRSRRAQLPISLCASQSEEREDRAATPRAAARGRPATLDAAPAAQLGANDAFRSYGRLRKGAAFWYLPWAWAAEAEPADRRRNEVVAFSYSAVRTQCCSVAAQNY